MKRLAFLTSAFVFLGCSMEPGASVVGGGEGPGPTADGGALCVRPDEGCPCDQETPLDCYPDPIEGTEGLTCRRGTRYCRGGAWTACESVHEYQFRSGPGIAPLVTGPSTCNPCDPSCAVSRDIPSDADLPGSSTAVEYDPSAGGILLESLPPPMGLPDSDGDGFPDVADDCPGSPGAILSPDGTCYTDTNTYFFHELPYGGPAELDPLDIDVQVRTADVYFLMDTTGSMGGEIANLRASLTSGSYIAGCGGGIIGAIRCTIPDAWFGVGRYDDYPVARFGSAGDVVFRHLQNISSSVSAAQAAVNTMFANGGYDGPESQTQALWAVATGGGLGSYLAPQTSCGAGTWGYPCFRDGTIPIVIHFTDAPMHNGPFGYNYNGSLPAVSWADSVNALNASGVRVITVHSGGTYGLDDANALADATGSYSSSGSRYVLSIAADGSGLSTAVVDAVVDLANYNRMDISARAVDNLATPVDETGFVDAISAVGWGPGSCTGSSGATFSQCLPGTNVDFTVSFRNDIVMPTMVPQVFDFFIEVLGDGTFVLAQIPVRIVVPATVPLYPPTGSYWREYDSTTFCAGTERPDWGDLTWEVVDMPAGTSVRWEIRASDDAGTLSMVTPVTATTPPSVAPLDVGALLVAAGVPNHLPYLRLTAVLVSNVDRTATPILRSFELRYTCTPTE